MTENTERQGASTAEQTEVVPEKLPVKRGAIDIQVGDAGRLAISSYNELFQVAKLLHMSRMAPSSLDTIEKIAIGVATCMEIGLPIFTGIQHVAVINGRASIWGDLVLSIIRGSGQLDVFKEEESGTPMQDDWTFTCTVKRKGYDEAQGRFSFAEAKAAGLYPPKKKDGTISKDSPWNRFTRRMMQWAARRWLLRDQFADILKGIVLAEDAIDSVTMTRDETGAYSAGEDRPSGSGKAPDITVEDLEDEETREAETVFMD